MSCSAWSYRRSAGLHGETGKTGQIGGTGEWKQEEKGQQNHHNFSQVGRRSVKCICTYMKVNGSIVVAH